MQEENKNLPMNIKGTELVKASKNTLPTDEVLNDLTCRMLVKNAFEALKFAYTPYSDFRVGAALLTKSQKLYTGCNIENAAYSPTNCAERTAFFKAVSEGHRDFLAIAIVGGKQGVVTELCPPCGVCRQVMMEFCDPDNFYVILATSEDEYWIYTLSEILPLGFSGKIL